jgi:hypothetical protein
MEQPKKPATTTAGSDDCYPIFQIFLKIFYFFSTYFWFANHSERRGPNLLQMGMALQARGDEEECRISL